VASHTSFTAFIFRHVAFNYLSFKLSVKQVNKTANFSAVDVKTHSGTDFNEFRKTEMRVPV